MGRLTKTGAMQSSRFGFATPFERAATHLEVLALPSILTHFSEQRTIIALNSTKAIMMNNKAAA
jgi:hypothetical protein